MIIYVHKSGNSIVKMFRISRGAFFQGAFGKTSLVTKYESQWRTVTYAFFKPIDEEYTDVPQYPKIQDVSFKARKERKASEWQNSVQKVPTVEEKMIYINMPRYYGYQIIRLNDQLLPYNCLPAIQHYTRTIVESMPSVDQDDTLLKHVDTIQNDVKDAVELAYDVVRLKYPNYRDLKPVEKEHILTPIIIEQINRVVINSLSDSYTHLKELEMDYNPRHEAFWAVGGIHPPKNVVKSKEGQDWHKEIAKDNVDRLMQYKGEPILALRHRFQIQPWNHNFDMHDFDFAEKVPRYEYDPRTLGFIKGYQHGTNITGYWPNNTSTFGYLSYHSRAVMHNRPLNCGTEDAIEALHALAIQSSFAWLLAQANYNGFNTYSELTYPMNAQTIITNGRLWSFYEYQLNTLLMHGRQIDENPRVNFCRGINDLSLYETVDDNGNVKGFNKQMLYQLIKFYTKLPNLQRPVEELQPYLGVKTKRIADYSDSDKREFLEKTFKHMVSNRPRHLAIPEIYLWEKIYKIDHKTRPLEARRRFFEVDINPWRRTLNQHQKEYIPKALRPEGPKSKNKWKSTYYPEVTNVDK